MADPRPDARRQNRGMLLLSMAFLAIVGIGFVTGIAPEKYQARRPEPRTNAITGDVPPARTHAELERRPWGSGPEASGWSAALGVAAKATEDGGGGTIAGALSERASLRAYDGAPPVVPHPIRSGGAPECLGCHAESFALAGRRANGIPHAPFSSCTQCHVSASPSLVNSYGAGPDVAPNRWQGLRSPTSGQIAYAGAPPEVPHATWMRERCDSCHGAQGSAPLRTPHPERQSCLQCHPAHSPHGAPGAR